MDLTDLDNMFNESNVCVRLRFKDTAPSSIVSRLTSLVEAEAGVDIIENLINRCRVRGLSSPV